MAIQTQVITGRLSEAGGQPIGSGFVRFVLSGFEATANGVIAAAQSIDAPIAADGSIAQELWPNTAGLKGTRYTVHLLSANKDKRETYGQISIGTGGPYSLADLLQANLPPATTSYWTSLTEAEYDAKIAAMDARLSTAETARDIATAARDTAIDARDAAAGSANAAYANAQNVASALVYQDLAGIAASKGLNMVAGCVYDTTKDFLGGLWRYQCSGKSWENEAGMPTGRWLGTHANLAAAVTAGGQNGDYFFNTIGNGYYRIDDVATSATSIVYRGARRDHPAAAVVIAEANRLHVFDGDDPALPMWMVYMAEGGLAGDANMIPGDTITSVAAENGVICVTTNNTNSGRGGLKTINLIADRADNKGISPLYRDYPGNIAQRNDRMGFLVGDGQLIINAAANRVAMKTYPGAEIDRDTGMPKPTIAVMTDGGVSVVKDDGSVVDIAFTTYGKSIYGCFRDDGALCFTVSSSTTQAWLHVYHDIPDADIANGEGYMQGGADEFYAAIFNFSYAGLAGVWPGVYASNAPTGMVSNAWGTPGEGLIQHAPNREAPHKSMFAQTRHDFATGWVMTDPIGCWLASTDASTIAGGEQLNDVAVSGNWNYGEGWSMSGGKLVRSGAVSGSDVAQPGVLTPGKRYRVEVTLSNVANASLFYVLSSPAAYQDMGNTANTTYKVEFVAPTDGSFSLRAGNNSSFTVESVSVFLVDEDRSRNKKSLKIFGSMPREPVETGADLVQYGPFAADIYLEQETFSKWVDVRAIGGWFDSGVSSLFQVGAYWGNAGETGDYWFLSPISGTAGWPMFRIRINGATYSVSGTSDIKGRRVHLMATIDDDYIRLYVNGKLEGLTSIAAAPAITFTDQVFRVGKGAVSGSPYLGKATWVKAFDETPDPEQVAKIYRDERPLFQPDAQSTLGGSVVAVNAVAKDPETGFVLAGNGQGISRFDNLLRVSHDATPITTAIAAGAGFEVTQ